MTSKINKKGKTFSGALYAGLGLIVVLVFLAAVANPVHWILSGDQIANNSGINDSITGATLVKTLGVFMLIVFAIMFGVNQLKGSDK